MNPVALPVAERDRERLTKVLEELARYGLGAFRPHKHALSGVIEPLPAGEVAIERDLRVSFVRADEAPAAVPVGWRWNGAAVEVCAACCTPDEEAPPI
jgi:hypothetical protein